MYNTKQDHCDHIYYQDSILQSIAQVWVPHSDHALNAKWHMLSIQSVILCYNLPMDFKIKTYILMIIQLILLKLGSIQQNNKQDI